MAGSRNRIAFGVGWTIRSCDTKGRQRWHPLNRGSLSQHVSWLAGLLVMVMAVDARGRRRGERVELET